ncbi:hypothetical protein MOQ_007457, partial [Trypanosoma cruzi marinkellei]
MMRSIPRSLVGTAARGVCNEAVAEGPGPFCVPVIVPPACPACRHARLFRWRPVRKAPVRKTVAPLRHPHVRPSPTIGTPGRTRQACALVLWTDECALPQIGQEVANPPLAGRQGVAVLTSGRGCGGGSGGPVSLVREGRHHQHRGSAVIRRARAGLSKSGQESHCACAQCRGSGHDVGGKQEQSPRHTNKRLPCGVRAVLFLLDLLPIRWVHCSEEAHVPGIDAFLREGSRHDGISVRCRVAWDSKASWGKYGANCVASIHQRKRHDANPLSDVVHRQRANAESHNRQEGVCGGRNSCGRLGCCCEAGNQETSTA